MSGPTSDNLRSTTRTHVGYFHDDDVQQQLTNQAPSQPLLSTWGTLIWRRGFVSACPEAGKDPRKGGAGGKTYSSPNWAFLGLLSPYKYCCTLVCLMIWTPIPNSCSAIAENAGKVTLHDSASPTGSERLESNMDA